MGKTSIGTGGYDITPDSMDVNHAFIKLNNPKKLWSIELKLDNRLLLVILAAVVILTVPPAAWSEDVSILGDSTPGTGVLFMYSDASGATLLLQAPAGNKGYLLPSTGTTVYVQVKGITKSSSLTYGGLNSGTTNIILQYNPNGVDHIQTISVDVASGDTDIVSWVVGEFSDTDGTTLVEIGPCETGIVFYGYESDTNTKFQTLSNGGSNGGHFFGPGSTFIDTQCTPPLPFPEFSSANALPVAISLLAAGLIAIRRKIVPIG